MTLRHLRDEISVAWDVNRAADSHVFGRGDCAMMGHLA